MEYENRITVGRTGPPRGRRPRVAEAGRVCADDECTTMLTRYNRSDRCYLHRSRRFPRIRGKPGAA